MAILVGDLACALTLEPLLATGFAPECKLRVIQKVNDLLTTTMIGQELDLVLEARGHATEQDVLAMYRLKTAYYSFVAPLRMGAEPESMSPYHHVGPAPMTRTNTSQRESFR